jgi:hypothetical protein
MEAIAMLPRPLLTPTLTLLAAAIAVLLFAPPATAEPACGTDNILAAKQPHASAELKGDTKRITDGIAAPEGSAWDAPITVTLGSGTGFITYDLGELRTVSAVVMQGDANDVYKVTGSADGAAGSFKVLVEVPNVVGTGHGLRTRAVKFDATKVRYLRIGEAMGDNFFSISELAAYCKAPTPFPPPVRVVDVPPAPAPESSATPQPGKDTGPSALLLTVIALSLVYLAYKMVLPRPPEPPTEPSGKDDDEEDDEGDDEEGDGGDKKADAKTGADKKVDADKKAEPAKDAPGGSSSDKSST